MKGHKLELALLTAAQCVTEDMRLEDALTNMNNSPLLVCAKRDPERLLGIVTAFDLL
jgi:CBS domain-containing protein